jgi:hypothetical protein
MWFKVEAVPLSFTESSLHRIENIQVIDATPKRVFEILATGEGMTEWFKDFVSFHWLGAPGGLSSERELSLKTLAVKERFIVWDEGRRLTFHVFAITLPLVTALIEDFSLQPHGNDRTSFAWRVHYRPTLLTRLVHPVVRSVFGAMFKAATDGLARYAKAHPTAAS